METNPILKRNLIDRYHILYANCEYHEAKNIDPEKEKSDGAFSMKLDEMLLRLRSVFPLGDADRVQLKKLAIYRKREMMLKKKSKELKRQKLKRANTGIIDLMLETQTSMGNACKDVHADKYMSR